MANKYAALVQAGIKPFKALDRALVKIAIEVHKSEVRALQIRSCLREKVSFVEADIRLVFQILSNRFEGGIGDTAAS